MFLCLKILKSNKNDLLNLEKAANNLDKPLLIIHGEQDLISSNRRRRTDL